MASAQITEWTAQPEKTFYSLSYDGHVAVSTVTLVAPLENKYGFEFSGISSADKSLINLSSTTTYDGTYLYNTATLRNKLNNSYTLTGASAVARLHSDLSSVVDTISVTYSSCEPSEILKAETTSGVQLGFKGGPINIAQWVSTLPTPDAGDYYHLNIVLEYNTK